MITEEKRVLRHETTVRRALWPPLIAMAILSLILLALVNQIYQTELWVEHSNVVILRVSRVMRYCIDMETGKRGYFLAGDRTLLEPYTLRDKDIDTAFVRLLDAVSDSPDQRRRAASMYASFKEWRAAAKTEITAAENSPSIVTEHNFDDRPDKAKMDEVRAKFDEFLLREQNLRTKRLSDSKKATTAAWYGGGAFLLLTAGLLAFTTRKQMHELSDQYETALDGESRVRERLATTLISIGDGVLVTDRQGNITLMNPVTEELTGWTQEEAHGKPSKEVFDIAHEETGEPVPSPIDQAIRENRSVLLANHTVLKRRDGTAIAIEDSASPVRNKRGEVSGVVLVFRDVTERKNKEAELAAALEKNERIAETLQRSMLITPTIESFDGLSLATLYEAAWDEAQVGGDFYDVFSFGANKVALVVGDATGKGLVAAAATTEVKYALRAFLYENDQPALAMARLNGFLSDAQRIRGAKDDYLSFSFISMALVVVDSETGIGRCAVAGAEPPLLLKGSGEAIETGEAGTMLGASPDSQYPETEFVFASGDRLVFTTDGITEARRGKREFFGYEGFTSAVQTAATNGTPTLDDIARSIVDQAKSYTGGRLNDDVCLLLVQRR